MKKRTKDLDVDFLGGQAPLTKQEERTITEYLNASKLSQPTRPQRGPRSRPRKSVPA